MRLTSKAAMIIVLTIAMTSCYAVADVSLETRLGVTTPHSEGRPIVRFLNETTLTYTYKDLEATLIGNVYGTQNWRNRVNKENGLLKVDAVRFEYGADIKYWVVPTFAVYMRHTMPVDRNDKTVGDGWSDTSYRWDVGVVYRRTF